MHGKAKGGAWQAYSRGNLSAALSKRSAWFLFLLAFIVVYREVFETILSGALGGLATVHGRLLLDDVLLVDHHQVRQVTEAQALELVQRVLAHTLFQLRQLRVTGPDVDEASVTFEPGLNVISGASDTGKSYVVETIDFLLGGGRPPRSIPESRGYDKAELVIEASDGKTYGFTRALQGGEMLLTEYVDGEEKAASALGARHSTAAGDNISSFLLNLVGLSGRRPSCAPKAHCRKWRSQVRGPLLLLLLSGDQGTELSCAMAKSRRATSLRDVVRSSARVAIVERPIDCLPVTGLAPGRRPFQLRAGWSMTMNLAEETRELARLRAELVRFVIDEVSSTLGENPNLPLSAALVEAIQSTVDTAVAAKTKALSKADADKIAQQVVEILQSQKRPGWPLTLQQIMERRRLTWAAVVAVVLTTGFAAGYATKAWQGGKRAAPTPVVAASQPATVVPVRKTGDGGPGTMPAAPPPTEKPPPPKGGGG